MRLKTNYAIALANLYGIVHKEKVVEIYNRQNKVQMDLTEIDDIMNQKQAQLNKYFTYINGDYFVQEAIIAFDECDLYLQEQDGKPYYIPKKRELLKYKDEAYFEKTPEYHRLVDFIKKHRQKDSVNSVEDICVDVVMHCQIDDSPNIIINDMNRLGVPLDTQAELAEAVELVAELSNNIRRWENNGFTPSELFEYYAKNDPNHKGKSANRLNQAEEVTIQPIIKGKKIGRNEPCPCGSGKKYKECCL